MSTTVLTQQVSLDSTGRAWDGGTAPWKWREFEGTAHRSLGIDEWNGPKNHWKFPIEINHLNKKQIDLIGSMNPKIIRLSKRFTSMPNIAEFAAHLALAQKNGRQKNPSHIWEFRGCLENVAVKHVIAGKHKGSKYLNVWQTPRTPLHSFLGHKSVSNFQINLVCIIYSYIYIFKDSWCLAFIYSPNESVHATRSPFTLPRYGIEDTAVRHGFVRKAGGRWMSWIGHGVAFKKHHWPSTHPRF